MIELKYGTTGFTITILCDNCYYHVKDEQKYNFGRKY